MSDLPGEMLRITFDSGSNRIYSIGTVKVRNFKNAILNGRYKEIGK